MDFLLQALSLEEFHHDDRMVPMFFDFVNGTNAGMVQRRGGTRLTLKPLQGLFVSRCVGRQEFQCHAPPKAEILRLINDSHAAFAQFAEHPVVGDRFTDTPRVQYSACSLRVGSSRIEPQVSSRAYTEGFGTTSLSAA